MTLRQRESVIGLSIFLLLPLTFLTTAFMVKPLMPGWMQAVALANPVNWALEAVRGILTASVDWHAALFNGGGLVVLSVLTVWLSLRTFRGYQRTV